MREGERERERERGEKEGGRDREREREREYLFLTGMTGALAPISYLVLCRILYNDKVCTQNCPIRQQ